MVKGNEIILKVKRLDGKVRWNKSVKSLAEMKSVILKCTSGEVIFQKVFP